MSDKNVTVKEKKVVVKSKNLQTSAQKLRLVVDLVRGMPADKAIDTLRFTNKKASLYVMKALQSAVASAESLYDLKPSQLVVSEISGDEAPTYKRIRYGSRGRVARINKRRSHLNLELSAK